MANYKSYIALWRKARGLTQREVVDQLTMIKDRDGMREKFPTTEASLSRVEKGEQNFNMALLTALAEVLRADEPGHLLTVNPFAGTLSLVNSLERLSPIQQETALKVIEALRSPMPDEDQENGEAA